MDLAQALSLLKSLKENVPNLPEIDKKWVDDFHEILATIEQQTTDDLSAFRIQDNDLYHPAISAKRGFSRYGRRVPGQLQRDNTRTVVPRTRLMHKLDALLEYLYRYGNEAPTKESIGFKI